MNVNEPFLLFVKKKRRRDVVKLEKKKFFFIVTIRILKIFSLASHTTYEFLIGTGDYAWEILCA